MKPELKRTHGKNGLSELPAWREHLHFASLVVMFTEHEGGRFYTKAVICCQVSDADLRDN